MPRGGGDSGRRPRGGESSTKGGFARKPRPKVCFFCKDKVAYVDYKDAAMLRRFMSDRGKIRARRVSGNCARHQREVAMAVKNAREMALLPYTIR